MGDGYQVVIVRYNRENTTIIKCVLTTLIRGLVWKQEYVIEAVRRGLLMDHKGPKAQK